MKRRWAAVAAVFVWSLAVNFEAQAVESVPVEAQYQAALDAVLEDVGNPEKSFAFVQAAVAIGDVRGAIAALERILLINPLLANIQLELGVLYLRVDQAWLARYHIRQSLRAANIPANVRARAERNLSVAAARSQRNVFRGELSLGGRYESNANSGPGGRISAVILNVPVEVDPSDEAKETDDWTLEGRGNLTHSLALSRKTGSSWDTNLSAIGNMHGEVNQLDLGLLRIETGPTIVVGGGIDNPISLRPFATGSTAWLDKDPYFDQYGGGIAFDRAGASGARTSLTLQYENFDYDGSQALEDRSGDYASGILGQSWLVDRFQLSLFGSGDFANADEDYQSYYRYGGGVGVRAFFSGGRWMRPWNIGVLGFARHASYDEADPLVNPDRERNDTRFDVTTSAEFGLTRFLVMIADVGYSNNDSNLGNYSFDNIFGGLRLAARY